MRRLASSFVASLLTAGSATASAAPGLQTGGPTLSPSTLVQPKNLPGPPPTINPCVFSQWLSPSAVSLFPLYGSGSVGRRAKLTVRARLQYQARRAQLVISAGVRDRGSGEFGRRKNVSLPVVVPAGCEIAGFSRENAVQTRTGAQSTLITLPPNNLLGTSKCVLGVRGDDWGRIGCSVINIQPFKVHFRKAKKRWCLSYRPLVPDPHEITEFSEVVRGDAALGPGTKIDVQARARVVGGTQIWVRSQVTLRESRSDRSELRSAWKDQYVGDVAKATPGCKVDSIDEPNPRFLVTADDDGDGHHYNATSSSYIASISCRVRGGSTGKPSCLLNFAPVIVYASGVRPQEADPTASLYFYDF